MTNQDMSSLNKEVIESEKKLRKRERKLNEKLQEALNEREEALERLRRAEARVQKRIANVQRLEARLTLVHQQLAAITTTTPISPVPSTSQAMPEEQVPLPPAEVEHHEPDSTEPLSDSTPINVEPEMAQIINTVEITGELLLEEALSARDAVFTPLTANDASNEQVILTEVIPILAETPETQGQTDTQAQARAARAAAEVAERDARFAASRAAQAATCLEQVQVVGGEAHHLLEEATQLQEEAEHLHALAQEKAHIAQVIEQQVQFPEILTQVPARGPLIERDEEDEEVSQVGMEDEEDEESETGIEEDEDEDEEDEEEYADELSERDELEHAPPVLIADFDAPPPALLTDYERAIMASPHIYPPRTTPNVETDVSPSSAVGADVLRPLSPDVTEIEEDEELVETVTSMLIADAAAEAAAQAEAFAEASAARTREARRRANQADSILQQIVLTISREILTGKQAEVALLVAERDVANAQAALADAEAAEARAMQTALNAEAEAEVAEGMAFSVDNRSQDKDIERTRPENSILFSDLDIGGDKYEDEEPTAEMPGIQHIRPKEMA